MSNHRLNACWVAVNDHKCMLSPLPLLAIQLPRSVGGVGGTVLTAETHQSAGPSALISSPACMGSITLDNVTLVVMSAPGNRSRTGHIQQVPGDFGRQAEDEDRQWWRQGVMSRSPHLQPPVPACCNRSWRWFLPPCKASLWARKARLPLGQLLHAPEWQVDGKTRARWQRGAG
jgi:hypothetical protein